MFDWLRQRIHWLQSLGHTGETNTELHALNCAQTDRLSDKDLLATYVSRRLQGLPTTKLEAAARDRGVTLPEPDPDE